MELERAVNPDDQDKMLKRGLKEIDRQAAALESLDIKKVLKAMEKKEDNGNN